MHLTIRNMKKQQLLEIRLHLLKKLWKNNLLS